MKKVAAKIITISSQLLIAVLFLVLLFNSSEKNTTRNLVIGNNNLNKVADKTSILFNNVKEKEESDVIVELTAEEEIEGEEPVEEEVETPTIGVASDFTDREVIETYTGNLTGYGPDCYGCTTGLTSTGHNLYNSIYYDDPEFGTIRILAADRSIPFYSIIRISNVPGMDPFLGIVLDRGGNVGFGKGTLFDLAFESEYSPNLIDLTHNVTFEMLRSGK